MQGQNFSKGRLYGLSRFFVRAKLTPFFIEKFILINKDRPRGKFFEPFEHNSKNSSKVNAILIPYDCIFKRSSKPVMKGTKVESIEEARNEYKKLLEEGWEKTFRFNSF